MPFSARSFISPRPDLDFEALLLLGDDGRVERLVKVRFGHGDEIAEALEEGRPFLVDDAEGGIAVLDRVGDDPERQKIVDLAEIDALALHLAVDAVRPLDPGMDLDGDTVVLHQALEQPAELLRSASADSGGVR